MYIGIAAEKAGDMATGKAFLSRAVDGLREQGRLGMLAQALVHHAWVATHTGDWKEAIRDGTEAATLARDTQQPQFGVTGELVAALASALRGEDIEPMLAESERALLEGGAWDRCSHLCTSRVARSRPARVVTRMPFAISCRCSTRRRRLSIDSCAGQVSWIWSKPAVGSGTAVGWPECSTSSGASAASAARRSC